MQNMVDSNQDYEDAVTYVTREEVQDDNKTLILFKENET